jgi:hypothetical protein
MPTINQDLLKRYRERSFRWERGLRLRNREQAVEFVNERGFVFFWPINGINFPSLWGAVAGDRPVADAHDDPGHVTWGWKDALLGKKDWYYAKILRKKGTMISMQVVPYFYALSENYGSPEEDYLTLYEQGRLTLEEKQIYEVLLENGPLDTVQLRKAARMTTRDSDSRFNRAITELQADFKIVPTGVTDSGAWHYAFAYDIATRPYPELIEESRYIGELDARQKIAELSILTLGAAQVRELVKLFGWSPAETQQAIDRLEKAGLVRQGISLDQQPGTYFALPELITGEAG